MPHVKAKPMPFLRLEQLFECRAERALDLPFPGVLMLGTIFAENLLDLMLLKMERSTS